MYVTGTVLGVPHIIESIDCINSTFKGHDECLAKPRSTEAPHGEAVQGMGPVSMRLTPVRQCSINLRLRVEAIPTQLCASSTSAFNHLLFSALHHGHMKTISNISSKFCLCCKGGSKSALKVILACTGLYGARGV